MVYSVGNISHFVRPAIEYQSVDCCVYWVTLDGTSNKIQAVRIKIQCLNVLVKLNRCVVFS